MLSALTNASIFTGNNIVTNKAIIFKDDKIISITDEASLSPDIRIIDCGGNFISPGLIDLQIAGGGGYLFSDNPSAEALQAMTESIVKSGTTGFLIAVPTNSSEIYHKVIKTVKENPHPAVLGIHLEGPIISTVRAGAHSKQYIRTPQETEILKMLSEAAGVIKMVTLAPEVCSRDIIKILNDNGVTVAAGHSNATYNEAIAGFKNGVRSVTHLFNAMSPLHHRDPGLPGAAFMTEGVYASIIADGIHVDYNVVSLSKKAMGERLYLVSDAVEECRHGDYLHIRRNDRFTLPDGTLSGSALSMLKAVSNCVNHAGIALDEALRMASAYPAKLINATGKGVIKPGNKADLIVFSKDFRITSVFQNGIQC